MRYFICKASGGIDSPHPRAYMFGGSWKINIKNLNDLMEFIEEVGALIINKDRIVIYDDYWE